MPQMLVKEWRTLTDQVSASTHWVVTQRVQYCGIFMEPAYTRKKKIILLISQIRKERKKAKSQKRNVGKSPGSPLNPLIVTWPLRRRKSQAGLSVICSTIQDWENLVASYKQSDKREDRKLYKLLQDCFLPEIREMFVEKKREERKKMQQQLSRRSSSRVEVLKKQQEERDRQLALQVIIRDIKQFLYLFLLNICKINVI